MADKYGIAVKWLEANPESIHTAWNTAVSGNQGTGDGLTEEQHREAHKKAGCLFKNCGRRTSIGCLTQVAHGGAYAETDELTVAIRADRDNIPVNGRAIRVEDLPLFAEWRRRVDTELRKARTKKA